MKLSLAFASAAVLSLASLSARADDDTVVVHVQGEGTLLHDGKPICDAPCDTEVPREGRYAVQDASRSNKFSLEKTDSFANVYVSQRTKSHTKAGGIILGTTLPVAAIFAALAFATANTSCSGFICMNPAPLFGVLSGMIGGGGLIAGSIMLALPDRTITRAEVARVPNVTANVSVRF